MSAVFRMHPDTYAIVQRTIELRQEPAIIRIDRSIPPGTIYVEGVEESELEDNPEVMLKR